MLVVGDPWRLVLLLAVLPLVVGSIITYLSRYAGGLWLEIGTGLIGGSVIGLVFALVQHTSTPTRRNAKLQKACASRCRRPRTSTGSTSAARTSRAATCGPVLPGGDLLCAVLDDGRKVDDLLLDAGLLPLAQRVPVLAYGANRNPHTLALKFDHHDYDHDGDAVAVPVLTGRLSGFDVVAAGLSPQGCLYADLTPSPGTTVEVHLTLLDVDQARAIHESEGVGWSVYDCARVPDFRVDGTDVTISPLAYAGCHPVFIPPGTTDPIAFSMIAAEGRTFPALEQIDLLERLIDSARLASGLAAQLGIPDESSPTIIAHEVARHLSGAWWYQHNTGDQPTAASQRIQEQIWQALVDHAAPRSTSDLMRDQGLVLDAEAAYASGEELRLAAQL